MPLTNNEAVDMIAIYFECFQNAAIAARQYATRYPDRRHYGRRMFPRLVQRLRDTESFRRPKRRRRRNGRTEENITNVLAYIEFDKHVGARTLSLDLGIARTTVRNILKDYRSEPCLWQVISSEYHDRAKKDAAYKLAKKLHELEPGATNKSVVTKINSLRSAFRKEQKKADTSKKSGASADSIYKPLLWYYDLFDFLHDQHTPRASTKDFIYSIQELEVLGQDELYTLVEDIPSGDESDINDESEKEDEGVVDQPFDINAMDMIIAGENYRFAEDNDWDSEDEIPLINIQADLIRDQRKNTIWTHDLHHTQNIHRRTFTSDRRRLKKWKHQQIFVYIYFQTL
ncbi:hypothetical protein MML48_8g00016446 [Holotrichia oblita]|uniref:Uncharacterized protein n=1 Tax=Holotrichia oblita TaxID=644536 RepID=A0ACB9SP80_HOLOL|nr:hypothetical protein MML48_8g00016446 [Holotrichia oblita]